MGRTAVATDDFQRADGDIGSNWTYRRVTSWQANPPHISSGKVHGRATFTNWQGVTWTGAGSFSDDQYSSAIVSGLAWYTSDYIVGVLARASGVDGTFACYGLQALLDSGSNSYTTYVFKITATYPGGTLVRNLSPTTWVDGDVMAIEVEGSTIRCYRNSTLLSTDTDTDIATGQTGILVGGTIADTTKALIDSWEGGNISTNPVPTFAGTISNVSATQSVAITPVDVHGLFSDTDALAYTASPAGTSWPSGLSINSSTGVISGTMGTVATTTGLKVRATDTASQTVDSNAFNATVSAPATRSISVTITSDGSTPRASETGLKAAWYDNTFISGSPLLTSSSKTTDGSGVLAWTLTGSTLGSGGVGFLVVTNSDGTTSQSPPPWAIALPVAVT